LSAYLKGLEADEIYVSGLAADYCVYFTAKDALLEGFHAVFIEDATRAINAEGFAKAKKDLIAKGAKFITSEAIAFC
jgi:nicotinamidase/pyrazinamidase